MAASIFILHPSSFIPSAHARLGETPAQIEARYGKMLSRIDLLTKSDGCVYQKGNLGMLVHFVDGVCDAECYRPYPAVSDALNETAIKSLLDIHAQDSTWKETNDVQFGWKFWERADARALAVHNGLEGMFWVCTPQFWKQYQQSINDRAREKLKGF